MSKVVKNLKQLGATTPTKDKNFIYKLLTDYLLNPTDTKLKKLCQDKDVAEGLKYRMFNYFLTKPLFVSYLDKYLNHIYFWNKGSLEDWFRTFADLTRMIGVSSSNEFYFPRFKSFESKDFFNIIRKYYDSCEELEPSIGELNSLFQLYKAGHISPQFIDELKSVIDGKEIKVSAKSNISTPSLPQPISPNVQVTSQYSSANQTFQGLSPEIQQFCNNIKGYVKSRITCRECPICMQGCTILDTNLTQPGPVDIVFIATHPDNEDASKGVPLIGSAGQLFRPYLDKLVSELGLTYLITNIVLCSPPNQTELKGCQQIAQRCKDVANLIHQQFQSKFKVLLGGEALKSYGFKGGISKLNGQLVTNDTFVMYHPNALQYGQVKMKVFDEAFANLTDHLKKIGLAGSSNSKMDISNAEQRIESTNFITKVDDTMTLMDIKVIENKVLFIFKDKDGAKKYLIDENALIPMYMKNGQYQECPMITPDTEAVCFMTIQQKEMFTRKLYNNMKNFIISG